MVPADFQSVQPPKNLVPKSKRAWKAHWNHQWMGNFEPLRVCIHRPTGKCWIERVPFRAIWWRNTCSSVRFVFVKYLLLAIEKWIQANYGPHNDPRIVAKLWNECTVMHPNMAAFRCLKNYCIFITISLRYSISVYQLFQLFALTTTLGWLDLFFFPPKKGLSKNLPTNHYSSPTLPHFMEYLPWCKALVVVGLTTASAEHKLKDLVRCEVFVKLDQCKRMYTDIYIYIYVYSYIHK